MKIFLLALINCLLCFHSQAADKLFGVMVKDSPVGAMPTFNRDTCSGSFIQSQAQSNKVILVSADHCIDNHTPGHRFEVLVGASQMRLLQDFYSYLKKETLKVREITELKMVDIFYAPLDANRFGEGALTNHTYKLAAHLPEPGEAVNFVGFPGAWGPMRVDCIYDGPTAMAGNPAFGHDSKIFILSQRLSCKKMLNLPGASGSPVLNKDGALIGILSWQDLSSPLDKSVVGFNELTENNLKIEGDSINFIKPSGEIELTGVGSAQETQKIKMKVKYDEDGFFEHANFEYEDGRSLDYIFKKGTGSGDVLEIIPGKPPKIYRIP